MQAFSSFEPLQIGIGTDFFRYMTPEGALESYKDSLKQAMEKGNVKVIEELKFRIELLEHFPQYHFDESKFTYRNTHGDYTINQIICGKNQITGIVDWTCACRHPVVWELVRSFLYAEPSAVNGKIVIDNLVEYCNHYLSIGRLNTYDIEHMLKLYYYQIAVCDYYAQYFNAEEQNKDEYLWQASYGTKVLDYLSCNIEQLSYRIKTDLTGMLKKDETGRLQNTNF